MSEQTITLISVILLIALIPVLVKAVQNVKRQPKTRGTMVAIMFGFMKIFEPSRVDTEEARPLRKSQDSEGTHI